MSIVERAINKIGKAQQSGLIRPRPQGPVGHLQARPSHSEIRTQAARKLTVDLEVLRQAGLLATGSRGDAVSAEFRLVKRAVLRNLPSAETGVASGNLIAISSAMPGAGKTFVAMNLARTLAADDKLNVVLVDADVAHPVLSRSFGLDQEPGLIELLGDPAKNPFEHMIETDLDGMMLLPAGAHTEEALEQMTGPAVGEFFRKLGDLLASWVIVIDGPPLLVTSESRAVCEIAGQVLFVVEAGRSTESSITHALELIDSEKPVNLILNKYKKTIASGGHTDYGYAYGNAYGYGTR